jgi:hypothetical protein
MMLFDNVVNVLTGRNAVLGAFALHGFKVYSWALTVTAELTKSAKMNATT